MDARDGLKRLAESAGTKLTDENLRRGLAKAAGDMVGGAAGLAESAEAVARAAGITNKHGKVTKFRLAKAALRPRKTVLSALDAAKDEVVARRSTTLGDRSGSSATLDADRHLTQEEPVRLFRAKAVHCPICASELAKGNKLDHWYEHCDKIPDGREGAGGYTWSCACGPASMYWPKDLNAAAGLAVHMDQRHGIPL